MVRDPLEAVRQLTLIVNPAAGRAGKLAEAMPAITKLSADKGFAVRTVLTSPVPGSATELARAASADSELVIVCGGDGTVHGVVQGVAGTKVPLGILPLGTANALARHLRLPLDPVRAMTRLLLYVPRRIALGEVKTGVAGRLFVVMAGCGPDGALVHELARAGRWKARYGRTAYSAHAARLFVTRRWPTFRVSYRLRGSGDWQETEAVAVMAARLPNLGGVFLGLTRGASLEHAALRVQVLLPPAWMAFPAWFIGGWFRVRMPWLRTLEVEEMRCDPHAARPAVQVQADAEPVGSLPCRMRMIPDALTLLMPP